MQTDAHHIGSRINNGENADRDMHESNSKQHNVLPEKSEYCGYGPCHPRWFQVFLRPTVFIAALCCFSFLQGYVVNGVNNANTASYEKRFLLSSARVGAVASSYDVVAAIFVIPISYFGAHLHKPRMLGVMAIIFAIGSFIMLLPHLTTDLYYYGQEETNMCKDNSSKDGGNNDESTLPNYLYVLCLGMGVMGIGGTALYTVGTAAVDESVSRQSSAFALSVFYASAALGPALGFLLGGAFLNLYVDVDVVPPPDFDETDARWIGAWWMGYVIPAALFVIVSMALFAFPRIIPVSQNVVQSRIDQSQAGLAEEVTRPGFGISIRDLPQATWNLLKNLPFVFVTLSGVSDGIVSSGFSLFTAKFIQQQFNKSVPFSNLVLVLSPQYAQTRWQRWLRNSKRYTMTCLLYLIVLLHSMVTYVHPKKVNLMDMVCVWALTPPPTLFWLTTSVALLSSSTSGAIVVTGAVTGQLVGGYVCKKAKLKVRGMLIWCASASIFMAAFTFSFWLRCDDAPIAGVNRQYQNGMVSLSETNVTAECNTACKCSDAIHEPVCGADTLEYINPCYAGCNIKNDDKTYSNCSCIDVSLGNGMTTARPGRCDKSCVVFYIAMVLYFFMMFTMFLDWAPRSTITLRCVPETQRTYALGVQWVFVRLLGTVPGPIALGAVVDLACKYHRETSDSNVYACLVYDRYELSRNIFLLSFFVKLTTATMYLLALFFYKPPKLAESSSQVATEEFIVQRQEDTQTNNTREAESQNTQSGIVNKSFEDDTEIVPPGSTTVHSTEL